MVTSKSDTKGVPLTSSKLLPMEEMLAVKNKQKKFTIGIPLEEDRNESRVSLTPLTVELLTNNGHEVIVQSNAGKVANFLDNNYSEAGAQIVSNKEEVYKCDILLKIAPLTDTEIGLTKGNQLIISSLNIATQNAEYIRRLLKKHLTCLAFEFFKDENDCYPVVRSMSEIAGSTSILTAAEHLSNAHGGKGEMLGGITGVNPSEVVIIGAGTAGEFAARTALGLGALVKIFDASAWKLKRLQNNLNQHLYTSVLHPVVLANALKSADVLIGAVRIIEKSPKYFVTEEMVKIMKKGSVIIDISIDQGGCIETSRLTTQSNPVFVKHGIVHYCVPNIASRVARTASYALSNIFAPLLLEIGKAGSINRLSKENAGFRHGIYIFNGILTNQYIGNRFNIPSQDINLLMGAF
ncbi:MAG: alanine dehydrogenase [Bacteroidetes bacterium CG23_combo_of_CG06-09_8_20_14_all_32_9]|nr:MAG: alanine dehydrogenase [Bacteroidetes bacterium CG23_combo_of_CG06-09_8_20_14_all_32_9]